MMKLFSKAQKGIINSEKNPLFFDLDQLKEGEYVQFRYDSNDRLVGMRKLTLLSSDGVARAESDMEPGEFGRVRYRGESWKAYCEGETAVLKDQVVLVVGQDGLTLFVMAGF